MRCGRACVLMTLLACTSGGGEAGPPPEPAPPRGPPALPDAAPARRSAPLAIESGAGTLRAGAIDGELSQQDGALRVELRHLPPGSIVEVAGAPQPVVDGVVAVDLPLPAVIADLPISAARKGVEPTGEDFPSGVADSPEIAIDLPDGRFGKGSLGAVSISAATLLQQAQTHAVRFAVEPSGRPRGAAWWPPHRALPVIVGTPRTLADIRWIVVGVDQPAAPRACTGRSSPFSDDAIKVSVIPIDVAFTIFDRATHATVATRTIRASRACPALMVIENGHAEERPFDGDISRWIASELRKRKR